MRKWNTLLSVCIMVLLVIHGIAGGFQLMGVIPGGNLILEKLSYLMLALIALHGLFGIILTVDSLRILKKAGKSYFRENSLFWARRISGFAVLLLTVFHLMLFLNLGDGAYRLRLFENPQLFSQLLLVAAIAVHVLTNIRPLTVALGAGGIRTYIRDILLILAVILLFGGAAFVIYYFRWNVLWR